MENCLVLGCGRSGTSLFMSLLRNSGYYMGENLYGPTTTNPTGYFESQRINTINENILKSVLPYRLSRHDDFIYSLPILGQIAASIPINSNIPIKNQRWLAQIPRNVEFPEQNHISQQIKDLFKQQPVCIKDPRLSYTLPYWLRCLNNTKIQYIVIFRHPLSTIKSIHKELSQAPYLRNKLKLNLDYLEQLWILIYNHILDNSKKNSAEWHFIHYEQILSQEIIPSLTNWLSIDNIDTSLINRKYYRSMPESVISEQLNDLYLSLCEKAKFKLP